MTEIDVALYVNRMSPLDKLGVYMDYVCGVIVSQHDFYVVVKDSVNEDYWLNGWQGAVSLGLGRLGKFSYVIKTGSILKKPTFESWTNSGNMYLTDNGDNWESNGFAQRMFLHSDGIYGYVYRQQEKYII